jgi:hypothetical protein
MNSEGFDPAREELVHLDSVEDVPVVRALTEIKVNGGGNATEGNVAME